MTTDPDSAPIAAVVDAHQHVGDLADVLSYDGTAPPPAIDVDEDAARRIAYMDAVGITWAVLQPAHGYARPDGIVDTQRLNDRLARYAALAPDRFRALGTTEPTHGQRGLAEVDRCHGLGLRGLAWHHRFQGTYIDSRWMWPTLERMGELGLVPLVHVNAESSLEAPWRLQRLARDFPDLPFLAMDGFWSYERAGSILATADRTPNVIWDLGGPVCYVSIEEWVRRNGASGICFSLGGGYDAQGPAVPPALLGRIKAADIGPGARQDILGRNVARAFDYAVG